MSVNDQKNVCSKIGPAKSGMNTFLRAYWDIPNKTFLTAQTIERALSIWEYFFLDPDKVLDANAIGRSEPSGYTCDRTQPMPTGDASLAKVKALESNLDSAGVSLQFAVPWFLPIKEREKFPFTLSSFQAMPYPKESPIYPILVANCCVV
ncbi:hypothetical protein TNCV_3546961 [Trichonephila clavipes]|nr:hypothetical protein TNCV_3546961 [Trichonephila clavipes]